MTFFPALAGVLAKCVGYAPPSTTSYRDVVESIDPETLVLYWPLNEAAGASAAEDVTAGNRDLAYGGTMAGFGKAALTLDPGTDTSIDLGGTGWASRAHDAGLAIASYSVSLVFVLRTAPAVGSNVVLFSKSADAPTPGVTSIEVVNDPANGLQLRAYAGGPNGASWIGSSAGVAALALKRACHALLTVDATAGAKLYLDGVQVASAAGNTQGWQSTTAEPVTVGAYNPSGSARIDGLMQHVAVWSRALGSDEAATLARADTPTILTADEGLTAYEDGPAVRRDVLANDIYPAGSTVVIMAQPGVGGEASVDPATQEILYTPPTTGTGSGTIGYRVDPDGVSGSLDVTVTVAPVGATVQVAQFAVAPAQVPGAPDIVEVLSQPASGARVYTRRAGKKAANLSSSGWLTVANDGVPGTYTARVRLSSGAEFNVGVVVVKDTIPAGAKTLAPSGGTFSDWRTALANLASGDTLVVRAGVYNSPTDSANQPPATGASNITIMAHPDDAAAGNYPIIWPQGHILRRYFEDPAGKWEADPDAPPGSNVYRTINTDIPATPGRATALYLSPGGHWVRMYEYSNLSSLRNTGSPGTRAKDTWYTGPGFRVEGGRIYVRLDPPPLYHLGRSTYPWSTYLSDFFCQTATEKNPNNRKIIVGYGATGSYPGTTLLRMTGGDVTVKNLWFFGGSHQIQWQGSGTKTLYGCRVWACVRATVQGEGPNGHCVLNNTESAGTLIADRCDFNPGRTVHITYNAGKSHSDGTSSLEGATHASARVHLFMTARHSRIVFRHSTVTGFQLHGWNADHTNGHFEFHHCLLTWGGYEGLMISQANRGRQHYIRNIIHQHCTWDYSYDGGSTDDWNATQRQIYVAFNLVVNDIPKLIFSKAVADQYTPNSAHRRLTTSHSWNGGGANKGMPRKYYYNTALMRHTVDRRGTHLLSDDYAACQANQPNHGRWGVNNILVQLDHPDAPHWQGDRDWLMHLPHPTVGLYSNVPTDVYDANHYYKQSMRSHGLVGMVKQSVDASDTSSDENSTVSIARTLADIRSKSSNKWEVNGTGGIGSAHDPKFVGPITYPFSADKARYCLQSGSPCLSGARDITVQTGWDPDVAGPPDMDGNTKVKLLHRAFRGCMDPDLPVWEQEIGPL